MELRKAVVIYRKVKAKGRCIAMFPYVLNDNGECKCFDGAKWYYREYSLVIQETLKANYKDWRYLRDVLREAGARDLVIKAKRSHLKKAY